RQSPPPATFPYTTLFRSKGADPNVADSTGTTALYSAVDMHTMGPMLSRPSPKLVDRLDSADIVRLLLAKGANVNARLKRPIIGRDRKSTRLNSSHSQKSY